MHIGINGMGRIGRLAYRAIRQRYPDMQIICKDRNPSRDILPLLQRDSIYGRFDVGEPTFICDSEPTVGISVSWEPWPDIDVLLECSGGGPDGNKARRHLECGAKRVIISAPASNVDATLILGVNERSYDPTKHTVISMASCTANCLANLLKVLLDNFTVDDVVFTSVNAYTNSQRIVDAPHNDPRRARAAALNIIPTQSSAIPSLLSLWPHLEGHIHGLAYRVPVACGSVVSVAVLLRSAPKAIEVNVLFRRASGLIIGCTNEPVVSSDIIGDSHSATIDMSLTEVRGNVLHLVAWFDNEWAYAVRAIDMADYIASQEGERGVAACPTACLMGTSCPGTLHG